MDSIGSGPVGGLDSGSLAAARWTDKSVSATQTKRGALDKPDFDFTELGLLFPQNDPSEKVYILDQMLHEKKFGTPIDLHIHYIQTGVLIPTFKAEYRYYNNGDIVPSWTTIATLGVGVLTYPGAGNMLQIIEFPDIPAPANENVSANVDLIIYRDDNVVTGDVLVKYIDFHYQKDSDGSRQEYVK